MSFGFSSPGGAGEWSSNALFADPGNWVSPSHWCMIGEILRFFRCARRDLAHGGLEGLTLSDYLRRRQFLPAFQTRFLLPMASAIWSCPETRMADYPARSFLQFFANHRLLSIRPPVWRTIAGGSWRYVAAVEKTLGPMVRKNAAVESVRRAGGRLWVHIADAAPEPFDHVIFACHPDEARAIASREDSGLDPDRALALAAIKYSMNEVVLHRDPGAMPKRRSAWASWNVSRRDGRLEITYWMNQLQHIDPARPLFVTLNPARPPAPDLVYCRHFFAHPQFDAVTQAAQRQIARHQGQDGVSFAGAWMGYGFHEDGLRSGLQAAARLGGEIPWPIATPDGEPAWGAPDSSAAPPRRQAGRQAGRQARAE